MICRRNFEGYNGVVFNVLISNQSYPTWFVSLCKTAFSSFPIYSHKNTKSTRWNFSPCKPSITNAKSFTTTRNPISSATSLQTASGRSSSTSCPPPGIIYHSSFPSLILIANILSSLIINAFAAFLTVLSIISPTLLVSLWNCCHHKHIILYAKLPCPIKSGMFNQCV